MSVKIREIDNTTVQVSEYSNFAVVIPGFCGTPIETAEEIAKVFDANGIYECTSQEDFKKYIGFKKAVPNISEDDSETISEPAHFGNQMAFEMLGLGYTVLFKKIENISELESEEFWECLNDKSNYDFRYIVSGFIDTPVAIEQAIYQFVCHKEDGSHRNDCLAIIDIPEENYKGKKQEAALTSIKAFLNDLDNRPGELADRNTQFIGPWVSYWLFRKGGIYKYTGNDGVEYDYISTYGDISLGENVYKFPGSFHYLLCAAKAAKRYAEWYSIAGYNRGVCDFDIIGTGIKLGDAAITALQPRNSTEGLKRAANLIINARGQYLLWGNRTAELLNEDNLLASHFLNIRQICYTIKKQIYLACKQLVFDPNSDILWINFKNKIRPTLEKMKADQGIRDYEFVEKKTNDEGISERGRMYGIIRIVPIEAVEDFDIDLYLEDSLATEE